MAKQEKIKRINLNMPIYILDEIDEQAEEENLTRTDVIINDLRSKREERKRKKILQEFLARKKPIFNKKYNKEIFKLGGAEWVKRLREEGEE